MKIDPLLVSVLTLVIAAVALVFGPGIGLRGVIRFREHLRQRSEREKQLLKFLGHSAVFLDGLPLFISETWDWGPSVPNYPAGGSFPAATRMMTERIPSVVAAVDRMLLLYTDHSGKQGRPLATIEEANRQLTEIQEAFWKAVEECAQKEWRLRWRSRVRELRSLRLPSAERDRIFRLKARRGN
jgi:hypothetical protein